MGKHLEEKFIIKKACLVTGWSYYSGHTIWHSGAARAKLYDNEGLAMADLAAIPLGSRLESIFKIESVLVKHHL